jgi:hypothetical protein
LANDDDRPAGIVVCPIFHIATVVPLGRGDEARDGNELLVGAHIDEGRRFGKSDQAGELGYGDFGWKWHGVHLGAEDLDAMFRLTPHGVIAIDPLTQVHNTNAPVSTLATTLSS